MAITSKSTCYKYMIKNGYRITRGRKAVLEILENEHLTFKEIQDKLASRGYHNVSSIYNILEFFVFHKLVTIIFMNDTKYYDLAVDNPMHTDESHIHMMIENTSEIMEISNKVIFERVAEIIKRDYNVDIKYIKITIGASKNE